MTYLVSESLWWLELRIHLIYTLSFLQSSYQIMSIANSIVLKSSLTVRLFKMKNHYSTQCWRKVIDFLSNCCWIVLKFSICYRIVVELISNWRRNMSNCCRNFIELLTNCRYVFESLICFRIFLEPFSSWCRIVLNCVEFLAKLSLIVVEVSNCCRNFVELLLNRQFSVNLLSNRSWVDIEFFFD